MKRKILAFALAVLMLVSVLPTSVFAADEHEHACPGKDKVHTLVNCPDAELVTVVKPTCTVAGYTVYQCPVCEEAFADSRVAATGGPHEYEVKEGEQKAPTCGAIGYEKIEVCKICGDEKYTGKLWPVVGEGVACTWEEIEGTRTGNCDKEGSVQFECTVCGAVKTEKIKKGTHEWVLNLENITKYPTATEDGKAVYECKKCFEKTEATIYRTCVHDSKNFKFFEAGEATCTDKGYDVNMFYCPDCDAYFYAKDADWEDTEDAAECGRYVNEYAEYYIHDALGHVKSDVIDQEDTHEATCDKVAQTTYCCARCGKGVFAEYGKEYNHTNKVIIEDIDPTCTEWGILSWACLDCGKSEVEMLKPTGHTTWEQAVNANKLDSLKLFMDLADGYLLGNASVTFSNVAVDSKNANKLTGKMNIGAEKFEFTYILNEDGSESFTLKNNTDPKVSIVRDSAGKIVCLLIDGEPTKFVAAVATDVILYADCTNEVSSYEATVKATYTFTSADSEDYFYYTMRDPSSGRAFWTDLYDNGNTLVIDLEVGQTVWFKHSSMQDVSVEYVDAAKPAVNDKAPLQTDPTCTKDGSREWYCAGCGKHYVETAASKENPNGAEDLVAHGHNMVDAMGMANCGTGAYTFKYCSNEDCDIVLSSEYDGYIVTVDPARPGLADPNGKPVHLYKPTKENGDIDYDNIVVPVKGSDKVEGAHAWQETVYIKNPTCLEAGEVKIICVVCGEASSKVVEKLEHNFDLYMPDYSEPTLSCSNLKPYKVYACSNECCLDEDGQPLKNGSQLKYKKKVNLTEGKVPAISTLEDAYKLHGEDNFATSYSKFYNAWEGDKDDCAANMERAYDGFWYYPVKSGACGEGQALVYCVECKEFIRLYIGNPDGHKEPTAAEWDLWLCEGGEDCKHTEKEAAKAEHGQYVDSWRWERPTAPTCTSYGYTGDFQCADCKPWNGGQVWGEYVDPIAHKLTFVPAKPAGCEEYGNLDGYFCSECEELYYFYKDLTGEMKLYGTMMKVIYDYLDAKNNDSLTTFNVPGASHEDIEALIPQGHDHDNDFSRWIYTTCETAGGYNLYCSICKEHVIYYFEMPWGHDFVDVNDPDSGLGGYWEVDADKKPVYVPEWADREHWEPWVGTYYCSQCDGYEVTFKSGETVGSFNTTYGHFNGKEYFHGYCDETIENKHCELCCEKCQSLEAEITPNWVCPDAAKDNVPVRHRDMYLKETIVDATADADGYYLLVCVECGTVIEYYTTSLNAGVEFIIKTENMMAPEGYKNTYADSSFVKVTVALKNFNGAANIWGLNFFLGYDSDHLTLIEEGEYAPKFVAEAFGSTGVFTNYVPEDVLSPDGEVLYHDSNANVGLACNYSNPNAAIDDNYVLNGELALVELVFVVSNAKSEFTYFVIEDDANLDIENHVINCDSEDVVFKSAEAKIEITKFLDGNVDGKIDIKDVRMAYEIMKKTLLNEREEVVGYNVALDTNKDGKIDLVDIRAIYEYMTSRGENYLELVDRVPVVEEEPEA